ncbi:E3 SUMO-protein ligase NSE2-like [Liolophura sinensis]|uniref:E3 SUMO-protein ligase NSE2-like n=1 Tax=Liolophura sinensis TaxID=3198878 RepID=UPI0031596484
MAPTSTPGHLAFVTQATNTLVKVKEYIAAGMETTLDVATDLFGERETVTLEVDENKVSELKDVMLSYIQMERELNHFLTAVDHTTTQAKKLDSEAGLLNLESILDQRLAELQEGYTDKELHSHEKYLDLLDKLSVSQKGGEEPSCSAQDTVDDDVEVACTQEDIITKCPITGKEMVDPMRNKHCSHSYEKRAIEDYIKRRGKKAKCPVGGCSNTRVLTHSDLEENKTMKRIIERKNRQAGIRLKRTDKMFSV